MNRGMDATYPLAYEEPARNWAVAEALRCLREDGGFYIPDLISSDPSRSRPEVYAAANRHARELRRAEQHLDDVLNLARVLRASLQNEDDGRAMQADTILKIIEKKMAKARNCIDRHDGKHLNLFMAYFDRKGGPDGAREG